MAIVYIPASMRDLTLGERTASVEANTVGEVIEELDSRFPGLKARLMANDALRPGLTVIVDGVPRRPPLGARVNKTSEVHIIPAISGGSATRR